MKEKRGIGIILIILFFFILINTSNVSAIGISGLRLVENFDFEPNLERTFEYRIGTNAGKGMNYQIYVKDMKGNIAKYISLSDELVYIEEATGYDFTAHMKLPQSLDAGMHTAYICVLEGETRGEGGNIGVKTEVCAIINVKVLYPGKYLIIKNFDINVANKQVGFTLEVENWGTDKISSAKTIIDIYEANKTDKVDSVSSNEESIASNSGTPFYSSLDATRFKVGDYDAKATVLYDGQEEKTEKTFKLGEFELKLVNYTREFETGKVNQMEIEVESIWNQKIENIYAEAVISGGGSTIQTIKTPPADIEAWERIKLVGYFDTTNVQPGEYNSHFTIFYSGKTSSFDGSVIVKEPERTPTAISTNTILLLGILLLLTTLIVLILKRKRRQ